MTVDSRRADDQGRLPQPPLRRADRVSRRRPAAPAKAIVLHDAEDVVHPLELGLFDRLIDRAAVDPAAGPAACPTRIRAGSAAIIATSSPRRTSRSWWSAKPSARRFRSPGSAARSRGAPLAQLAALQDGRPFAGSSMTEDYEVGLRLGALGLKTMFVRIPAHPGERGVVASRGHFPATLGAAVRQKARWLGGIALAGWDRLGWSGGLGERWMRMRDRRGPLAALLLLAAYARGVAVVADLARRGARRADPGAARPGAGHVADDQRLAACVARTDARRLHRVGLWLARRAAVDAAAGGRQRHRHAGRRAAPSRSTSAAARRDGTRRATSSRRELPR